MPYKNRKKQLEAMRAWYRERYAKPEFKSSEAARRFLYYWTHRKQILEYQRLYRLKAKIAKLTGHEKLPRNQRHRGTRSAGPRS